MVNESFDRQGDLPVLLAMQAVAATYPAGDVTREAEDALRRAVGGETTSLLVSRPLARRSCAGVQRRWGAARDLFVRRHRAGLERCRAATSCSDTMAGAATSWRLAPTASGWAW